MDHCEHACDLDEFALTVGEIASELITLLPETDFAEHRFSVLEMEFRMTLEQSRPDAALGEHDEHIVEDRHLLEETHILEGAGHTERRYFVRIDRRQAF